MKNFLTTKFIFAIIFGSGVFVVSPIMVHYDFCEPSGIQQSWLCDAKLTDILLVFLTYCLAVVGWVTMRSNEIMVCELERARLFGSPVAGYLTLTGDGKLRVPFLLSNQGKTAGILKEIVYEFSPDAPSGRVPAYRNQKIKKFDDAVPPAYNPTQPQETLISNLTGVQYCYGYIGYNDVFGKSHISRFCNKIDPIARKIEIAGSPEWSSDD